MILLMQYLRVEQQNLSIVLVYSLYNISHVVLMHDVRGVSTPIRFLMLRDCQNLEYEQQTMGVWMQEKGHTTVEGIN